MDKKLLAKHEMLKLLSKQKADDMKKGVAEELNKKKMQKVTVAAPTKEGLKKGLSLAEKLIAAKLGKKGLEDLGTESETDEESGECEECPVCDGKGCPVCEDDEESEME